MSRQNNTPFLLNDVGIFSLFLLFFALLYLQVPLKGHMSGNTGHWTVLVMGNLHIGHLQSWLSGTTFGTSMYPVESILHYGESTPLMMRLYALLKIIIGNDIWSIYVFIVLITVTSAFAVFKLARHFTDNVFAAIFAGFAFGCSNFWFSNADDTVFGSYMFPALCFLWAERFFSGHSRNGLRIAAVVGGMQAYVSMYTFAFQSLGLTLIVLAHLFKKSSRHFWKEAILASAVYTAVATPIIAVYLYRLYVVQPANPYSVEGVVRQCSLAIIDLFRTWPGNLLYPQFDWTPDAKVEWAQIRRHGFVGLLLWILAACGTVLAARHHFRYLLLGIFAFLICLGPTIKFNAALEMLSPLKLLYQYVPLFEFVRVPLRSLFVVVLVLSLFASLAVTRLFNYFNWKPKAQILVLVVLCTIHFFENVPFPMPSWEALRYADLDPAYQEFAEQYPNAVVVDLPSNLGLDSLGSDADLYPYNRESIYMYYQTQHGLNILNGVNGYPPKSRLQTNEAIKAIPRPSAMNWLVEQFNVSHVVFHKKLRLSGDRHILDRLRLAPFFEVVTETDQIVIWQIVGIPYKPEWMQPYSPMNY